MRHGIRQPNRRWQKSETTADEGDWEQQAENNDPLNASPRSSSMLCPRTLNPNVAKINQPLREVSELAADPHLTRMIMKAEDRRVLSPDLEVSHAGDPALSQRPCFREILAATPIDPDGGIRKTAEDFKDDGSVMFGPHADQRHSLTFVAS